MAAPHLQLRHNSRLEHTSTFGSQAQSTCTHHRCSTSALLAAGACMHKRQHTVQQAMDNTTGSSSNSSSTYDVQRRVVLKEATAVVLGFVSSGWMAAPARAGLLQLPATMLHNRYFLARAGESDAQAEGIVSTNPAFKTSMSNALTSLGKQQAVEGILPSLNAAGVCDEGCWLWPSIATNAYQTAEILAVQMNLGRNRIVPEYSFLDARGAGALEGAKVSSAMPQLAAGDALDPNWKPVRGYDGTPNESAADVLVRMRQLLSVMETQYSGEDVVIVAPDSDCLSVLQAAALGVDLRQHRRYAFGPGEARPLLLSTTSYNDEPARYSCPNPPSCSRAGP